MGNDFDQRTEGWHADRAGCFTASRFRDLRHDPDAKFKSGPRKGQPKPSTQARTDYINQVVAEILTGTAVTGPRAKSLDYGTEMEPEAVAAYEQRIERMVELCGFTRHPDLDYIGASPDFLVGDEGGGEVKCPYSITVHAGTLRAGIPPEHIEQIQGGLLVTGRKWWDFISYHPAFPGKLALYVQRVERDDKVIARILSDCKLAWSEVEATLEELRAAA